jgi:hypothetical protein
MPSDGTIGGLIGRLDVLRVECPTCGRQGRYHVARLLEELGGPGARLWSAMVCTVCRIIGAFAGELAGTTGTKR